MIKSFLKKTVLYRPLKFAHRLYINSVQRLYCILVCIRNKRNIKRIRKYSKSRKIKIAFLTMYSTSCQCFSIFEEMLKSNYFEPKFIVNPDILRGKIHQIEKYKQTLNELIDKYGSDVVLQGYDFTNDTYYDYTKSFDVAITNNPYDSMAHDFYKSRYWIRKGIPLAYISYYYFGRDKDVTSGLIHSDFFNNLWVYFAENEMVYEWIKKDAAIKGRNVFVSGYPKLDALSKYKDTNSKCRIIIAPHHTIGDMGVGNFSVGSFLDTADVIFNLPKKYSDINFVFRPHPLLKTNLKLERFWGEEKTEKWFKDFLSNKNVELSTESDYFNLFINSTAMIHDCGSFTAEYLCVGKPCGYLYKKNLDENLTFTEFGKQCIHNHYILRNENDLYDFIDNVILNHKDSMKQKRETFAKNIIMYNYPNSTKAIYDFFVSMLIDNQE